MPASSPYAFYSWQSDLPAAHNRNFIEGAIEEALRQVNADAAIESSPRGDLALDKDTQGVAGSPAITETIIKKIEGCSVFIGDLSFVAQSLPEIVGPKKPARFVPNPKKKTVRRQLVATLVVAIRAVLEKRVAPPSAVPFIGTNFSPTHFASQAKSGDLIIDGPLGDEMQPYAIPERCTISLRLQPTVQVPEFESEGDAFQAVVRGRLRPMAGYEISGQSAARNTMGGIVFVAPQNGNLLWLSQLFLKKELYGIDAGAAGVWRDAGSQRPMFHVERVEESYAFTLRNYLRFARRTLDLPSPWKVFAGIYGVQNFTLAGRRCLKPEIHWSATVAPDTSVLDILTPFFINLWKAFTVERPGNAGRALANLLAQTGESE